MGISRMVYVLVSAALVWAALADWKTLRIPRLAGWGVLASGLFCLLAAGWYGEALLYTAIVLLSSLRGLLPVGLALALSGGVLAQRPESLALVIGVWWVLAAFRLGWLGGGDAQLALGLLGIGPDGWMLALLGGVYLLVALVKVGQVWGPGRALKRVVWVARHLDQAGQDPDAIKIPWAVVAGMGGLCYLWLLPGLVWR